MACNYISIPDRPRVLLENNTNEEFVILGSSHDRMACLGVPHSVNTKALETYYKQALDRGFASSTFLMKCHMFYGK